MGGVGWVIWWKEPPDCSGILSYLVIARSKSFARIITDAKIYDAAISFTTKAKKHIEIAVLPAVAENDSFFCFVCHTSYYLSFKSLLKAGVAIAFNYCQTNKKTGGILNAPLISKSCDGLEFILYVEHPAVVPAPVIHIHCRGATKMIAHNISSRYTP